MFWQPYISRNFSIAFPRGLLHLQFSMEHGKYNLRIFWRSRFWISRLSHRKSIYSSQNLPDHSPQFFQRKLGSIDSIWSLQVWIDSSKPTIWIFPCASMNRCCSFSCRLCQAFSCQSHSCCSAQPRLQHLGLSFLACLGPPPSPSKHWFASYLHSIHHPSSKWWCSS